MSRARTQLQLIFPALRDTCEQNDGMQSYRLTAYDTRVGWSQTLHDQYLHIDLTTDFLKTQDGDSWAIRVSCVLSRSRLHPCSRIRRNQTPTFGRKLHKPCPEQPSRQYLPRRFSHIHRLGHSFPADFFGTKDSISSRSSKGSGPSRVRVAKLAQPGGRRRLDRPRANHRSRSMQQGPQRIPRPVSPLRQPTDPLSTLPNPHLQTNRSLSVQRTPIHLPVFQKGRALDAQKALLPPRPTLQLVPPHPSRKLHHLPPSPRHHPRRRLPLARQNPPTLPNQRPRRLPPRRPPSRRRAAPRRSSLGQRIGPRPRTSILLPRLNQ